MNAKIGMTLAMSALAGAAASVAQAQSITTLFQQNNGGNPGGANYFQVVVGATPITITSIAVNTSAVAGTAVPCRVYTAPTTHAGNEGNPAVWTLVSEGAGTAAGTDQPTAVTLGSPIILGANTSYGFAITLSATSGTPAPAALAYSGTGTNPAPGLNQYSNSDLTLNLGTATNVSFTLPTFNPRIWNGTLNYTLGGTVGACCLPSGACVTTTSASCTAQSGTYQGDNVPCSAVTCPQPPTGACCLPTSPCVVLTAAACAAQGGTYLGNSSSCGSCPPITCFEATGLAVPITSTTTPGTQGPVGTASLSVAASQTITSMFAKVQVAHTWQGDARIELRHPDGTTIDLVTRPGVAPPKLTNNTVTGFSTDNFGNPGTGTYMTFIDSASSVYDDAIGFPGPPAGTAIAINNPVGPYRAHGGSLNSTFGGKNTSGTWQLLGSDYWTGDEGTIVAFAVCVPGAATGPACYANCDNSTNQPCLNVQDFGCFLNAFAAGSSYANCDNSTSAPVLNVQDFGCFLNAFAAGCSSCV